MPLTHKQLLNIPLMEGTVDREIWEKIVTALPTEYQIPDPAFTKVFEKHRHTS